MTISLKKSSNHYDLNQIDSTSDDNDILGQRVTIPSLDNITGVLRYVGTVDNKSGIWAGIELDNKGQGKNDGSVQGKSYFSCPPNSGIFIAYNKIIVLPPSPSVTTMKNSSSAMAIANKPNLLSAPRSSSTPKISSIRSSKQNLTSRASKQNLSGHSSITRPSKQNLPASSSITRPSKQNLPTSSSISRPSKQNLPTSSSFTRASKQNLPTTVSPTSRVSKQNLPTAISPTSRPSKQNLPTSISPTSRASKQNLPTTVSPTSRASKHNSLTSTTSTNSISRKSLRNSLVPISPSTSPSLQHNSSNTTTTTTATSPSSSPSSSNQPKKSSPSPQDDATHQLYDMLEKIQRERDQLLSEMKTKETAWERLVSSKESLLLQVEENESHRQRLSRELELSQLRTKELEESLAERDASIAKTVRDEEKQTQDQKRIEKLEHLLRELQQQVVDAKQEQQQLRRDHAGALEQARKEVALSEQTTASLEKECEDLRKTGLDAIHAYEASVVQLKQQHELALQQKEQHIKQLDFTIADLRHKQSTLFDDEEERDHFTSSQFASTQSIADEQDQRHRLEEQLELAMAELDNERRTIQTMSHEMEQLKLELAQSRKQLVSSEQKVTAMQVEYDREVQDKKRLMEEADNAFESQAKAEDELYQLKLSKKALEDDYNKLLEANKQLEQDYNSLMDEMLLLEKQDLNLPTDNQDPIVLQKKIDQLEKENENHRHSLSLEKNQVQQLSKDIAELESLVENRVFGEAELEEQLEDEKAKVRNLQKQVNSLKEELKQVYEEKNIVVSPSKSSQDAASYCELCEQYGHDILQCKSEIANLYCENCDSYGDHVTEECPNQDETF